MHSVEMVAVALLALTFILSLVQGVVWYLGRQTASAAAYSAARTAAAFNGDASQARNDAETYLSRVHFLPTHDISISRDAENVTVVVSGTVLEILPGKTFTTQQTVQMPIERLTQP